MHPNRERQCATTALIGIGHTKAKRQLPALFLHNGHVLGGSWHLRFDPWALKKREKEGKESSKIGEEKMLHPILHVHLLNPTIC